MSERGAISPEWDEIVGERGAELSGAVWGDFERWSGGSEHPRERGAEILTDQLRSHALILTSCITVWYGACNASCRKSLQRIVRAAEKIVDVSLPSLQDIYSTRLTRKALSIAGDPTHPSHSFFSLLPSGRRLRSLQARTSRLKDSFIH